MPLLASFSKIHFGGAEQWTAIGTTGFTVREGVRGAVAQLPIAYSSFGHVDKKCNTGGKDAYESSSNPSGAGIEDSEQSISNAGLGVDRTETIGVFDLAMVS